MLDGSYLGRIIDTPYIVTALQQWSSNAREEKKGWDQGEDFNLYMWSTLAAKAIATTYVSAHDQK